MKDIETMSLPELRKYKRKFVDRIKSYQKVTREIDKTIKKKLESEEE